MYLQLYEITDYGHSNSLRPKFKFISPNKYLGCGYKVELVSKELNHLAAILQVYAWGFEFYEVKKKIFLLLFFKKKMEILLHF